MNKFEHKSPNLIRPMYKVLIKKFLNKNDLIKKVQIEKVVVF